MKKTQFIELCALIRRTLVPFFSIVLFVTMGITLYAGMTWAGQALENCVDQALNQDNAYDFTVVSNLGLSDSDISEIGQIQGVTSVEPAYVSYQTLQSSGESLYCTVHSLPEKISTLNVVEGTLPDQAGEIALLSNCTEFCDYKIGDTITFDADGTDSSTNEGMKYLKKRTYTITALVSSPDYLSSSFISLGTTAGGRQVTCVFYAVKDAFSTDEFEGAYPYAYVVADSLHAVNTFSSAYTASSGNILTAIRESGSTLAQSRYTSLKESAESKIASGQEELDAAYEKITDAEAQITAGEQELADKKSELVSAQAQVDDATAQLESKMSQASTQFSEAESQISSYQAQLDQLQQQYDQGLDQIHYYERMSASLKTLSDEITTDFTALRVEIVERKSDPDFDEWREKRVALVNAATAEKVAAFKQEYPERPSELEPLLDGLELSATSEEDSMTAGKNAYGLSSAADKILSEGVEPGKEKLATLKDGIDQLTSGIASAQEQLDAGRAEYNTQTSQAQSQIAYAKSQIASGESQIASAESQLADGKTQLASYQEQYAAGQQKLQDAKARVALIQPASWVVSSRADAYAAQMIDATSRTLDGLRLTMASLFIIVGLLVCYSVMSRLVHEQQSQLGTKKALGFTQVEISRQFLSYAFFACILGILLGALVGAPVVQWVLLPKMNQYVLDDPGILFNFTDIIPICLIELVFIGLSSWLACRSMLRKNATALLAGQKTSYARRRFYENWPFWDRMSLLSQTMINNCFNDKRRVFGTLVGVAGCTALIVCAITLQGGIAATINEQEQVIERYDQVVYVSDSATDAGTQQQGGSSVTVDSVLASSNYTFIKASYTMQSVDLPDSTKTVVALMVPQRAEDLSDVMTVQITQGRSSLGSDGVCISCALADYYHYSVGDELTCANANGSAVQIPITGIFNYYGGSHIALMSGESYYKYFGKTPTYSARMVATGENTDAFATLIKTASDFDGITNSRATTHEVSESVNSLALTVVAIYVGISALVALFVLLNLNVMFISEKRRELIVMMINGYEVKDAKRYVSRDAIIMNALGMIVGCLLGTTIGILSIHSLQNSRLAFIANVSPVAWVVGIVVCAFFSFLVMHIALRRVDKFRLTSVNE